VVTTWFRTVPANENKSKSQKRHAAEKQTKKKCTLCKKKNSVKNKISMFLKLVNSRESSISSSVPEINLCRKSQFYTYKLIG
jgi:hypothetical protein